jgi:rhomboid protease GluP
MGPSRFPGRPPLVTATVLGMTGAVTALAYVFPAVLAALQRSPATFSDREWWRLITPLFVNPEGWRQIVFNFTCINILGTIVERLFGRIRWLILYFGAGVVGELAGLAWKPFGGGASVAGCGLLGALGTWLLTRNPAIQARVGGGIILAGAITLTAIRDLHGPPILAGMCLAFGMLRVASHGYKTPSVAI